MVACVHSVARVAFIVHILGTVGVVCIISIIVFVLLIFYIIVFATLRRFSIKVLRCECVVSSAIVVCVVCAICWSSPFTLNLLPYSLFIKRFYVMEQSMSSVLVAIL